MRDEGGRRRGFERELKERGAEDEEERKTHDVFFFSFALKKKNRRLLVSIENYYGPGGNPNIYW